MTYLPGVGGSHAIIGVFDATHQAVEVGPDGLSVTTTRPAASLRLADLPVAPHVHDRITIGLVHWEVTDVHTDGSGMALLYLIEVA